MTITLRQKDLENDNKSLYLDIYDNGKRKFEFLSLYLIPEINQETKERNEATLKRAQEIRAERILHPETIPEKGHLMVVPDIPDDDSPEVIDWKGFSVILREECTSISIPHMTARLRSAWWYIKHYMVRKHTGFVPRRCFSSK